MSQLHRVLYCSRFRLDGSPDEVAAEIRQILAVSRANNAADGVTGGLLFGRGCFAQVLEGPLAAVEAAFERIQCDERHWDVTVLQSGPTQTRDFGDWSMAYAGEDVGKTPLTGVLMDQAFSGASSAGDEVLGMLKALVRREHEWASTPA